MTIDDHGDMSSSRAHHAFDFEDSDDDAMRPLPPPPHPQPRPSPRGVESDDDAMRPLSPPPRPQARPSPRGVPTALQQRATSRRLSRDAPNSDDDVGAPQPPPLPHTHPFATLSSNTNGNEARRQHPSTRAHAVRGKRLDPAFFNPQRINAFLRPSNSDVDGGTASDDSDINTQVVQMHSSRMLERHIRAVEREAAPLPDLLEDERVRAATDASHWRSHELHPLPVASSDALASQPTQERDSALARARVRKVAKQVDAKWLATQRDAANRPLAVLARTNEQHLREQLVYTSACDILASGLLLAKDTWRNTSDVDDGARVLPLGRSNTIGLPGCCFDTWAN